MTIQMTIQALAELTVKQLKEVYGHTLTAFNGSSPHSLRKNELIRDLTEYAKDYDQSEEVQEVVQGVQSRRLSKPFTARQMRQEFKNAR